VVGGQLERGILVAKKRDRKVLPITFTTIVNPATALAIADTGAEENAMSFDFARLLGLEIKPCTEKSFTLANGNTMKACGSVVSFCAFGTEQYLENSGISCIFNVFQQLTSPLIICMAFLETTMTLIGHRDRLIPLRHSFDAIPRVRAMGIPRKRLLCSLDDKLVQAVPDTGSEVDLMSLEYAHRQGYNVKSESVKIMFADGSIVESRSYVVAKVCIGTGIFALLHEEPKDTSEGLPPTSERQLIQDNVPSAGSAVEPSVRRKVVEVKLHILDGLTSDILLSEDTLETLDAFTEQNADFIVATQTGVQDLELNLIRLVGPIEWALRQTKERISARMRHKFAAKEPGAENHGMSFFADRTPHKSSRPGSTLTLFRDVKLDCIVRRPTEQTRPEGEFASREGERAAAKSII
jgi:predicted aspartyl protease